MNHTEEIEAIYAMLPAIQCQRKCWDACGPITMSVVEADRIVAHVAERPLRAPMETDGELCPALSVMGACMIYEVRPLICRLYGLLKALHCPHGCRPAQWINNETAHDLMMRLEALGEGGRVLLPLDGAPGMEGITSDERERALFAILLTQGKGGSNGE